MPNSKLPASKTKPAASPNPSSNPTAGTPAKSDPQPQASSPNTNTLKIVVIVVAALIGLGLLGSIVSAFVARSIVKHGLESVSKGHVTVDSTGKSVTVQGKNGSATFSTDGKLPSNWPSDVPVYEPSTVKLATQAANNAFSATWSTNDAASKVSSYYKDHLRTKGWSSKDGSEVIFGTVSTISFLKDNRELVLIVTGATTTGQQTAFSVSITPKPNS